MFPHSSRSIGPYCLTCASHWDREWQVKLDPSVSVRRQLWSLLLECVPVDDCLRLARFHQHFSFFYFYFTLRPPTLVTLPHSAPPLPRLLHRLLPASTFPTCKCWTVTVQMTTAVTQQGGAQLSTIQIRSLLSVRHFLIDIRCTYLTFASTSLVLPACLFVFNFSSLQRTYGPFSAAFSPALTHGRRREWR